MGSRLQRELKQARPFASPEAEATVAMMKTADAVRWRVATAVEPAGVTLQQYNVLRILRGAGDAGLPTLDIVDRLIEHTPGVTRLLDRLEAKGLVRRERCPRDRRRVLCWVTAAGTEVLDGLASAVAASEKSAMAGLSREQVEALIRILDQVRINLE